MINEQDVTGGIVIYGDDVLVLVLVLAKTEGDGSKISHLMMLTSIQNGHLASIQNQLRVHLPKMSANTQQTTKKKLMDKVYKTKRC